MFFNEYQKIMEEKRRQIIDKVEGEKFINEIVNIFSSEFPSKLEDQYPMFKDASNDIKEIYNKIIDNESLKRFIDAGAADILLRIEKMEEHRRALNSTKIKLTEEEETSKYREIKEKHSEEEINELRRLLIEGKIGEFNEKHAPHFLDLAFIDLTNAKLSMVDFSNTDMSYVKLLNAELSKAKINSSSFCRANLSKAKLTDCKFDSTHLSGSNFSSTHMCNGEITYSNLSYANLSYANFSNVRFYKVKLSYANLHHAILSGIEFYDSNLSYADLSYSDLSNTDLRYANLSYSNLSYSNLSYANLIYSDLSWATLSGSVLSNTNLEHARLNNSIIITRGIDYDFSCKDADFDKAIIIGKTLLEYLREEKAKNVPETAVSDKKQFEQILQDRKFSKDGISDLLDYGWSSSHPPE